MKKFFTAFICFSILGTSLAKASGPYAYITNSNSDSISIIDTSNNTTVGDPIDLGASTAPRYLAITPNHTYVYASHAGDDNISVIDTSDNSVTTITASDTPNLLAVSPDSQYLYALSTNSGILLVYDIADGHNQVGMLNTENSDYYDMSLTSDGAFIYALAEGGAGSPVLKKIKLADLTYTEIDNVDLPNSYTSSTLNPDDTTLYFTDSTTNLVTRFDLNDNAITSFSIGGNDPIDAAFSSNDENLYVLSIDQSTIAIVSASDNSLVDTIALEDGSDPFAIDFASDGRRAYVINQATTEISVVNAVDHSVVTTVSVGELPWDIVVDGFELLPSETSLNFEDEWVGSTSEAQTFTLTNTKATGSIDISDISATGDFESSNDCGSSLAAGASCTVSVTFAPSEASALTGTLTVTSTSNASPNTVDLSGTGVAIDASLSVSQTALSFDSTAIGVDSEAQTITLSNDGNVDLTLTTPVITGDYAFTTDCADTLTLAQSCTVSVIFTPTASGSREGSLTLTSSADSSPDVVTLTGTGFEPTTLLTLSKTSLDFEDQTIDTTSEAQTLTLTNSGTNDVTLTSLVADSDFSATDDCDDVLVSGDSCTVSVVFSPTTEGDLTGTLTITSNADSSPDTVALTGTGEAAASAASGCQMTAHPGTPATSILILSSGLFALGACRFFRSRQIRN